MNRRDTLAGMVAFGAVAGLPAVRAQSPKSGSMPVLGVLSTFPIVSPEQWAANAREDVEMGGVLSYGPDLRELFRRAAAYVDKVLRGANPKDLPIELPSSLELTVNRRTAKLLSLTIPQSLQARADRFID